MLIPQLRPTFEAALRDVHAKDRRARAAAADVLCSPPDGERERALAGIRVLADDEAPEVRFAAVAAIGQLCDVESVELVLARFSDGEPMVREAAIIAAGQLGDMRAREPLAKALREATPEARFQAVVALAELAGEESLDDVIAALDDPDAQVRGNAVSTVAELGDERAVPHLVRRLSDSDKSVRREAALALADFGDARGASVLREALDDAGYVFQAANALGELGVVAAREDLARLATGVLKPLPVRAAAGAALERLGDPRGRATLRTVLRAWRSAGRGYAAELVGELELAELADDVARLVDRPRGADPTVVAGALAKLAKSSEIARAALAQIALGDGEPARIAREAQGVT